MAPSIASTNKRPRPAKNQPTGGEASPIATKASGTTRIAPMANGVLRGRVEVMTRPPSLARATKPLSGGRAVMPAGRPSRAARSGTRYRDRPARGPRPRPPFLERRQRQGAGVRLPGPSRLAIVRGDRKRYGLHRLVMRQCHIPGGDGGLAPAQRRRRQQHPAVVGERRVPNRPPAEPAFLATDFAIGDGDVAAVMSQMQADIENPETEQRKY